MGDELNFYYQNDEYWIVIFKINLFYPEQKILILKSFVDTKSFLNMQQ